MAKPKTSLWDQHRQDVINGLVKRSFWSTEEFIPSSLADSLLTWAQEIKAKGRLKPAAIGKGPQRKVLDDVRSDKIFWIDDFLSPEGKIVSQIFQELIAISREELFLPAKRFECHLAHYEVGDRYVRHRDRHRLLPSRLLSCVLYLNTLQEKDGGQLVLYQDKAQEVVLSPNQGRLVIFDSGLEHEVLPCHKERWSVTGWLRDDPL